MFILYDIVGDIFVIDELFLLKKEFVINFLVKSLVFIVLVFGEIK